MENKIANLIEEAIKSLNFNLVQVKVHGTIHKIIEILIERQDGENVTIKDCQLVSKNISAILDVEDIISDKYFLEVSSAGVERPLIKLKDYEKFTGKEIKIRLKEALNNNYSFRGELLGVENESIKLKSKNVELLFAFDNIKNGKLVMTDEMFQQALNKNKQ